MDVPTDGASRIAPPHLQKIGGSDIAAQFPPEAGGEYLGFMEVLHQLHCVVSLRPFSPDPSRSCLQGVRALSLKTAR